MGKFNKKDEGVKPTIVNHMGEKRRVGIYGNDYHVI